MAFCINCGQELSEGAKFCGNCGKAVNDNNSTVQRKIVYDGELHKCPNCGERLDSFVAICPACGYELRGAKATSCVNELAQKLESSESVEQKVDLIRNFYIPNTKEDIHEFFILAISNIKIGGMNSDAWMVKLEQAYQKATLSFSGTQEFEHLEALYKQAQIINRKNTAAGSLKGLCKRCLSSGYFWAVLIIVVGGLLCFISGGPDESGLGIGGIFCILGGIWVALFAYDKNEKKLPSLGQRPKLNEESTEKQCNTDRPASEKTIGKAKVPYSVANGTSENYAIVETLFIKAGFTNVRTIPLRDLTMGILNKPGSVDEITIGGKSISSYFRRKFDNDIPVIITYHSFR